jgi:hypothetical protein
LKSFRENLRLDRKALEAVNPGVKGKVFREDLSHLGYKNQLGLTGRRREAREKTRAKELIWRSKDRRII